ncbi:dephospho-CoA kinase [Roseobacter sp. HKCCA0434]|uniref:dephospho-CoA kinase n=1 Tax=Roseobacter sp. HKCCA0434 TaxID=3079297 RepID=UPI002905C603|nr:dephospho-CoA kinase [Roseobacter sp. HKCCA0434]
MIPHRIGLTGSIGMGKSTTAAMFAEEGVPVWDADAAVHELYSAGGAAVEPLSALLPEAASPTGIDRTVLRTAILADTTLLQRIERIVHPLVAANRAAFAHDTQADIVLYDIPLLFETGQADAFDTLVVVSSPAEVQRARVLARPGMTEAAFEAILAKQVPDAQKRAQADHVIDTSRGLDPARAQVRAILAEIRSSHHA